MDCCNHNCNEGRKCPERAAHRASLSTPEVCSGGITFAGPEPVPRADGMLALTALIGVLAVACLVGMAGWFLYVVWPVLVVAINR